jgi:transcription elongation factor GreB
LIQHPVCFLVSKAFTRESDESGAEEIPSVRTQLPAGARNYITREGADRLRQRLNELVEKRHAGATIGTETDPVLRADQRRIESEIRKTQSILDSLIIAETPADREKVAFGASVTVAYGNDEEEAYQIVGVDEADPAHGRISWISPLARALLSRRAGETVRFQSPAGDQQLTILKVQYDAHSK